MSKEVDKAAIAEDVTEVLKRHLGPGGVAVALVWYREEDQETNLMQNVDGKTTIAILADAIKIAAELPRPS